MSLSAARAQPRFTARLVVPTPPVAPATAITVQPCGLPGLLPSRCRATRCNAAATSSALSGWVRNSLAPARIARRIRLPSVELLVTRIVAVVCRLGQLGDQFEGAVRIRVERDKADVGLRLTDDVGKELVARALGLEPDGFEPQQRRLERFARRVFWVDDGDTQDVSHG